MASKDKTSKTARVMNLLSKKPDPNLEPEAEAPAEKPAAPVPPVVASIAPDAAVSVQIKNALEDALERELEPQPGPEPQPEHVPVQISVPGGEPEPEPDPVPAPEPTPEPAPAAQEPAPIPAALVEEPTVWKEPLQPEDPGYINVMQVLVEEKAPKYVKMFGLCSCERCMEDVKAFALNHLPPKYVVMEPGDRIPRITVYDSKFSSDVVAQLLQACKVVHETPHHSRG